MSNIYKFADKNFNNFTLKRQTLIGKLLALSVNVITLTIMSFFRLYYSWACNILSHYGKT